LHQRLEQDFVRILQIAKEQIALIIVGQLLQRAAAARDLAFQRADVGRQQPVQAEEVALLLVERGTFVGERIGEQRAGSGWDGGDGRSPAIRSGS
jgi:hypothetical protein